LEINLERTQEQVAGQSLARIIYSFKVKIQELEGPIYSHAVNTLNKKREENLNSNSLCRM